MRIAKAIAASGLCSRREAERWIAEGRVKLDGRAIDSPAINVSADSQIEVDNKPIPIAEVAALWLFHKPKGVMTTKSDPQGRPIIYDYLPSEHQQLHPVGRLDYNSEGLLLLTNNGELKRELELPSTALERVYRVRVKDCPSKDTLARLTKGVKIGGMKYRPLKTVIEKKGSNSWLQVTLTEGKNREIRRVFEHFGHPVSRLIRIAYGEHQLGDLATGKLRKINLSSIS